MENPNDPILLHTNDFYSEAASEYRQSQICEQNREHYRVKPYYERFRGLFNLSRGSTYFFSIGSIATATGCVFAFLFQLMPLWLAMILSLGFLAIIERAKHLAIPDAFKQKYQYNKFSFGNIMAILTLVALSGFLSFNGANRVYTYMSTPPALIDIDSIESSFDSRFAALATEDSIARDMTWRGKVVKDGRALMINIAERKKTLQTGLNYERKIAQTENNRRLTANTDDVELWALYFALFALFCDFALLVCFWFQEHYRHNSHIQFAQVAAHRLKSDPAINTTHFSKSPEPITTPDPESTVEVKQDASTVLNQIQQDIQKSTNPTKTVESIDDSKKQPDSLKLDAVIVAGYNKNQPMTYKMVKRALGNAKSRLKGIKKAQQQGTQNKGGATTTVENNIVKLQSALNSFK